MFTTHCGVFHSEVRLRSSNANMAYEGSRTRAQMDYHSAYMTSSSPTISSGPLVTGAYWNAIGSTARGLFRSCPDNSYGYIFYAVGSRAMTSART